MDRESIDSLGTLAQNNNIYPSNHVNRKRILNLMHDNSTTTLFI